MEIVKYEGSLRGENNKEMLLWIYCGSIVNRSCRQVPVGKWSTRCFAGLPAGLPVFTHSATMPRYIRLLGSASLLYSGVLLL